MVFDVPLRLERALRVLLFDHHLHGHPGHHLRYASYLIQHLVESGDDVGFLGLAGSPLLEEVGRMFPSIRVEAILHRGPHEGRNELARQRLLRGALGEAFRRADQDGADVFHHLYMDRAEIAWWGAAKTRRRRWK